MATNPNNGRPPNSGQLAAFRRTRSIRTPILTRDTISAIWYCDRTVGKVRNYGEARQSIPICAIRRRFLTKEPAHPMPMVPENPIWGLKPEKKWNWLKLSRT